MGRRIGSCFVPQALAFPDVTSVRVRDSGGDSIIDWSAATSSVTELP